MLEDVLAVALDPARRLAPHEIPVLEHLERLIQGGSVRLPERPSPEDPSHDRGIERDRARRRGERIQARCDRGADRPRQILQDGVTALRRRRHQLLDEQRVALPTLREGSDQIGALPGREMRRESDRVRRGQRCEVERRGGPHGSAPSRPALQQLGPREGQQQHRRLPDAGGEGLEEVEEARIGPVDVLEHQEERTFRRDAFDQPACRVEEHLLVRHHLARGQSDQ